MASFAQQYYTQNKGQWNDSVAYKKYVDGAVIYLKPGAISILQYDAKQWAKVVEHPGHQERLLKFRSEDQTVNYHHFEIKFVGANPNAAPHGEQVSSYYLNYFIGNDKSKWAANVRDFGIVRYPNLYPNIDLILHGSANGLKYDLVLKEGANLNDIQIQYNNVDKLVNKKDSLQIKTSIGSFFERMPHCWQYVGDERTEVDFDFVLKNNVVSFKPKQKLNKSAQVIIDPEVVFATYAGNSVDNFGFTATYDTTGSLYAGGISTSPDLSFNANGTFPATSGAFSTTYSGGVGNNMSDYSFPCDITLSKYSPDGTTLIYATYLGGWHNEYPHSIVVDHHDQLIVFGTTFSSNYPTSDNPIQTNLNGFTDIIVTKFNAQCTDILGSTFIGGSDKDGLNEDHILKFFYADNFRGEVQVDSNGLIYASSCTKSGDFPMVDAFQSTKGGEQDGVFMVLNKDLSQILWSTYLGGSQGDALYSVDLDDKGIIYVSGGTRSSDLPKATAKIGTKFKGGVSDGFIARLDPKKHSLEKVAYWGSDNYDQIFSLEIDNFNKVYVVGQTLGKMPVMGKVYQNPKSGQFLSRFDHELDNIDFTTVFGTGEGSPDITINAFLVDECRKIFVSGWGGATSGRSYSSTHNLPITPDAYQDTTDGSDFYLMVLSKNAKELLYGTYFGGSRTNDHVDGGTSRFDKKGVIYQSVCASCPANQWTHAISDFPTTPGAYAEKNVSPRCSNAAFKIAFGNLNRKPNLKDTLYSFTALDTFTFLYFVNDPDEDSLFITVEPDQSDVKNMVSYKPFSSSLENWAQYMSVTAGCDRIGDTLNIKVYALDQGCPAVLDSTAYIRIAVTPPPALDPPKTICLNFITGDGIKLTWDPIAPSNYYSHTTLYKIDPDGNKTVLATYQTTNGGSYTDFDVINPKKKNYQYYLVVTNLCGKDGEESYRISTTEEFEFPIKPTYVVTATVTDDDNIQVKWLHSTEDDFGSYDIYRKKNYTKEEYEYLTSTYSLYDTSIIDKNVDVDHQSYCYVLVVNDNCGHRSSHSNSGCTIVLEGSSEPFEHQVFWNEYKEWPAGVNEYVLSRCVDTGSLRPIVSTWPTELYYRDTSFDYDWGGYWYRVTGYEQGGHLAESQSNRIYLIQPPLLHVPNAFTPNGDNLNELWGIVPVFVKEYEVQVYDRWGEKVYDSNDKKTDWDGFYRGKQEGNVVFIYKIRFTGWDRSVHHRKGTVTVLK